MVWAWPGISSSPALGKRILVPAFQPGLTVTSRTFSLGTRRPDPSFCLLVIFNRFVVPVYKLQLASTPIPGVLWVGYSSRETGRGRVMTSGSAGGEVGIPPNPPGIPPIPPNAEGMPPPRLLRGPPPMPPNGKSSSIPPPMLNPPPPIFEKNCEKMSLGSDGEKWKVRDPPPPPPPPPPGNPPKLEKPLAPGGGGPPPLSPSSPYWS